MRPIIVTALIVSLSTASIVSAAPFEPPASAASASSVNVANDPILKPYQKRATTANCTSSTCNLVFPNVTETRIVITHVSCSIALSTSDGVVSALLTTNNLTDSNFLQMFTNFPPVSGSVLVGTNSSAYLFIDKGNAARINFEVAGGGGPPGGADCTISGYHT